MYIYVEFCSQRCPYSCHSVVLSLKVDILLYIIGWQIFFSTLGNTQTHTHAQWVYTSSAGWYSWISSYVGTVYSCMLLPSVANNTACPELLCQWKDGSVKFRQTLSGSNEANWRSFRCIPQKQIWWYSAAACSQEQSQLSPSWTCCNHTKNKFLLFLFCWMFEDFMSKMNLSFHLPTVTKNVSCQRSFLKYQNIFLSEVISAF